MKLKVYNTLSRQKEDFIPLMEDSHYSGEKKDFVGVYSCGPTVYGLPHFGNVRAAFTADMIRNTIQNVLGYPTISVMNITDVGHLAGDSDDGEEKMEKAARSEGLSSREIAKKYEELFLEFFENMQIERFSIMPRATEHIQEQIDLVQCLEAKGYTYEVPGDGIYMDTSKVEDYGKLLGPNYKKHLEGLRGGERVDLKGKRNLTDFALWKFHIGAGKRDMERESPWGVGFPGWHAECSAMSSKYLGKAFDIHHGGYDLISVHHTNEIAQSECCNDTHPWVKYWLHNQFVNMNGKKMSKSDGNTVSPYEVIDKGYAYLDIRYFFFTTHYRSFFDFTWESMEQAKRARENLSKKLARYQPKNSFITLLSYQKIEEVLKTEEGKQFLSELMLALLDDFNTSKVISLINAHVGHLNQEQVEIIARLEQQFLKVGLFSLSSEKLISAPAVLIDLAEQRLIAKQEKNYERADELREQIAQQGWTIKDTKEGYELIQD